VRDQLTTRKRTLVVVVVVDLETRRTARPVVVVVQDQLRSRSSRIPLHRTRLSSAPVALRTQPEQLTELTARPASLLLSNSKLGDVCALN
jgi:hypothetical protein